MKTLISLIFFFTLPLKAAKYSGYMERKKFDVMTEFVEDIRESRQSILIGFSNHDAYYNFPKKENKSEVIDFLNKRKRQKIKLKISFDRRTAKIISLEDLKK